MRSLERQLIPGVDLRRLLRGQHAAREAERPRGGARGRLRLALQAPVLAQCLVVRPDGVRKGVRCQRQVRVPLL